MKYSIVKIHMHENGTYWTYWLTECVTGIDDAIKEAKALGKVTGSKMIAVAPAGPRHSSGTTVFSEKEIIFKL